MDFSGANVLDQQDGSQEKNSKKQKKASAKKHTAVNQALKELLPSRSSLPMSEADTMTAVNKTPDYG